MRIILSVIFFNIFFFNGLIAQDYNGLGDEAMNNGNYQQAVDFYRLAFDKNQTDEITKKINLAQNLKKEFDEINSAINSENFILAETHINNVLMVDPSNRFIEAKRQEIKRKKEQNSSANRKRHWENFKYGFQGDDDVHERFGGFHIQSGYMGINTSFYKPFEGIDTLMSVGDNNNAISVDMYYNNSKKIPITIDFGVAVNNLNGDSYVKNFSKYHLGLSFSYRIFEFINLDFGTGYQWGRISAVTNSTNPSATLSYMPDYMHESSFSDPYYQLGCTMMFENEYGGGISYHYISAINSTTPMRFHNISYIFGKKPSIWIICGAIILGLAAVS